MSETKCAASDSSEQWDDDSPGLARKELRRDIADPSLAQENNHCEGICTHGARSPFVRKLTCNCRENSCYIICQPTGQETVWATVI